jgi:uncharacterized protein YjlB
MTQPETYILVDDGIFPNSHLPVLVYRNAVKLPLLFPGRAFRSLFEQNGWSNSWKDGIYTFHHYHSNTHEALGVCKGKTVLQFGGDNGIKVFVAKGDVVVIPAGVAHKNLGDKDQVACIGAYPEGRNYDMNVGKPGERPQSDQNILAVPLPATDPVEGKTGSLVQIWKTADEEQLAPAK